MKPILFLVLALCANLSVAEVYKCKDTAGKVLYQDTPCPTGQQKVLKDLPNNAIKGPAVATKVAEPSKENGQKVTEVGQNPDSAKPSSNTSSNEGTSTVNCSDERFRNSDACKGRDLLRNKDGLLDRANQKPIAPVKPQPLGGGATPQ